MAERPRSCGDATTPRARGDAATLRACGDAATLRACGDAATLRACGDATTPRACGATTIIRFRGRLVPASFAEFARHRAARLDLRVLALTADAEEARAHLAGPAALLDAFEMACSLGPLDCIVLDTSREAA